MNRPTKEKTIASIILKLALGCILVGLSQSGPLVGYGTVIRIVKIPSLANALVSAEIMIVSLVSYLALGCLSFSAIAEGKNYFKFARTSSDELKEERTKIKLEEACRIKREQLKKKESNDIEIKEDRRENKNRHHIIIEGIKDKE